MLSELMGVNLNEHKGGTTSIKIIHARIVSFFSGANTSGSTDI